MMKVKPVKLGKTERDELLPHRRSHRDANLIEVQKNSYQWFLDEGLREVFHDIGTIEDYTGNLALSFVDYRLDIEPKYSIKECKSRDVTYAAPLRVTARLLNKEDGRGQGSGDLHGRFPPHDRRGHLRHQRRRARHRQPAGPLPGRFLRHGPRQGGQRAVQRHHEPQPRRLAGVETDATGVFYVRIDKNRKLPVTVLCRALGLSTNDDILNYFGEDERILATFEKDTTKNTEEGLLEVYRKLRPGEPPTWSRPPARSTCSSLTPAGTICPRFGRYKMNKKLSLARRITGQVAAENVVDPLTGELLIEAGRDHPRQGRAGRRRRRQPGHPHHRGQAVKVITNGCVDAQPFFSFDVKECGINERCSFDELRKILDTTSDPEEQKELLRAQPRPAHQPHPHRHRHPVLHKLPERPGPRHRHHRRHRPPGQPPHPQRGRAAAEPVPHRLLPDGARDP